MVVGVTLTALLAHLIAGDLAPFQTIQHCPQPSCSKYIIVEVCCRNSLLYTRIDPSVCSVQRFLPDSAAFNRYHPTHNRRRALQAENFTATSSTGWRPQSWAHDPNLFASDVSNVFMNRRAYLHADANASTNNTATADIFVPKSGAYTILVRYEAGYRFSSPFTVSIAQGGNTVFHQLYGNKESPRVWGFSGCTSKYSGLDSLSQECRWNYGSTENMVWEGPSKTGNYTAILSPGLTTITITAAIVDGEIAERNIDTIVMTTV